MEIKLNLCAKINTIMSKIIFRKKITVGFVKTGNKAILNGLLELAIMIFIKKIREFRFVLNLMLTIM
jgi:hypothetical protein